MVANPLTGMATAKKSIKVKKEIKWIISLIIIILRANQLKEVFLLERLLYQYY
ncbi:MAG: hypothetical protein P8Y70_12085 [Candidatus Lokiarchaeota archaeon]